ncbi:MAG TPA: Asd/ArgC dimerization domain-containing protein, partial [Chitinivibrionales bacterium]
SAYSIGRKHRHIAEIDQELSVAAGKKIAITFSPHLAPMNRGILSTIYLTGSADAALCLEILRKAYKNEPFIRVREPGDLPSVRDVAYTNFCDMSVTGGTEGQPVIIVSALDNLLKGASGQALQNMNIMFGFAETTALL